MEKPLNNFITEISTTLCNSAISESMLNSKYLRRNKLELPKLTLFWFKNNARAYLHWNKRRCDKQINVGPVQLKRRLCCSEEWRMDAMFIRADRWKTKARKTSSETWNYEIEISTNFHLLKADWAALKKRWCFC